MHLISKEKYDRENTVSKITGTFSRYRKHPLHLMCSWFSISAVSRLKCSRSLSSRSSRHRIYCCTSRTTCALRRSSSAILRKPANSRVTERLWRRAVQTSNSHGGHSKWLRANSSAIVHEFEPLAVYNASGVNKAMKVWV